MSLWQPPSYYQRHTGRLYRPRLHRTITVVSSGTPSPSDSNWAINPGAQLARLFVYTSFTGGTSPAATVRYWLRSPSGDTSGVVAKGGAITIAGNDRVVWDVSAEGDDLLVVVESVSGSPTSFSVTIYIAWR